MTPPPARTPLESAGMNQSIMIHDSWLMQKGEEIRGHEFHYSTWENRPDNLPPAYNLIFPSGRGESHPEGASIGPLWASYVHLPFWNKPELALRFVAFCRERIRHAN